MIRATACGKAILFGEHAVVYGEPAIAVPIPDVRAEVAVSQASQTQIDALDLGRTLSAPDEADGTADGALWNMLRIALDGVGRSLADVALQVTIRSSVPVARGMGSGTAVATAIVRAVASYYGIVLSAERVSGLVFRSERLLHGTPSGVDNTVVAYEVPVFFVKGQVPERLVLGAALSLVIGDTGIASGTREAVAQVRDSLASEPRRVGDCLAAIGELAHSAQTALQSGDVQALGALMDRNQALLVSLGVSCPALDHLVLAARKAGALGAKLSGGGLGGCMIALTTDETRSRVAQAMLAAGAVQVFESTVADDAVSEAARRPC